MVGIELDRQLGTVTFEPGVTTLALSQYVAKHAPELAACVPLHMPTGSALGNAMDGGVGVGPYADRFAQVYSLEVVLGTGEVIRTGMDRAEGGERLGRTETRVGPSLRDLFMQSNFGVVTRMTMGLFPLPGDLRMLAVKIESKERVCTFVERMRPLILGDVLTRSFQINNDYIKLMSGLDWKYPWLLTRGRAPLPKALLRRFHEMLGGALSQWEAYILLSSPDATLGRAREQVVRKALRGFTVKTSHATSGRKEYFVPRGAEVSAFRWLYWRKPNGPGSDMSNLDPNRDRCGFMWCDFVMPMDPDLFVKVVSHLEQLVRSYGFEPAIEVHTFWPRALFLIVNLAYDRDVPHEDARALKCDQAMTRYLAPFGILPSRRRVGSMDLLAPTTDDSAEVLGRIKSALDPARVISPGRYETVKSAPEKKETKTGTSIVDVVERIHLDLLTSSRGTRFPKTPNGLRPLRPHLLDRSSYEQLQTGARALLPALLVAAKALAAREDWRDLLSLDEDLAAVTLRRIEAGPPIGKLEGAFDSGGRYRVFGFDSRVEKIHESPAQPRGLVGNFWRAPCSARELQKIARAVSKRKATAHSLLDNLGLFAMLSDPAERPRLTRKMSEAVNSLVPWTRVLRSARTTFRGKSVDLPSLVRDRPDDFVIRPASRMDDTSTVIGAASTQAEWNRAVRAALRKPGTFVVQEHVRIQQEVFPLVVAGQLEFEGCFVGADVVVLAGAVTKACITRISETPKVGTRCAGTQQLPCFVASR